MVEVRRLGGRLGLVLLSVCVGLWLGGVVLGLWLGSRDLVFGFVFGGLVGLFVLMVWLVLSS